MDEFIVAFEAFYEVWHMPINIVFIIIVAVAANLLVRFIVKRVVSRIVTGVKKRQRDLDTQALLASPLGAARIVQRTETLGSVLNNIAAAAIVIVAAIMIVTAIDANVTGAFALITAALGAGLGFGAQNIVKDVLSGLFMVAEDQLGVGDVVDLGQASGVVEAVGIRITQVRDVSGVLWSVRNGEILRVGNKSQGWARVIIDLPAPYTSDVEALKQKLLATANTMAKSAEWRRKVLEEPEIWGVESITAEALVIRLVMKVRPAEQWDVARELRLRLKLSLDDLGVNIPALNRMVVDGLGERAPAGPGTPAADVKG